MKKQYIALICIALLLQLSCTKKFDEINTNPNATTGDLFDPNYLLATAEWQYSNTGYSRLIFESMWTQVLASPFDYYSNGDKYSPSTNTVNYQNAIWEEQYRNASLLFEMQNLTKGKDELSNLYNVGAIMKAVVIQQITDVYGDIPYSEALRAKEGILQPKYDKQQDIYMSLLTEVETAINSLDATKPLPTSDLIYGGDITKWKKFGYSVMLKLAMRLTKVDPTTAQQWAEKAAAGGTFASIDDNARIKGNENNFANATSNALRTASDYLYVRWSETFIDQLKATNDPRISAVAEIPQAGLAKNGDASLAGDNTPSKQVGLPNGYTLATIVNYSKYPGASGTGDDIAVLGNYSRPRTEVYLDRSGLNFILTYAQTELLLAEAKARGWNVGTTSAAQHYANGVAGAMNQLEQLNAAAAIDDAVVNAYVAAHPLDVSSAENSIKEINEQYWLATGGDFDFIENWINWRRSGYPELTPVNFAGNFSNGTIPRRIPYYAPESAANPTNYQEAVGRQGADTWTTRVWWDVQ